MLAVPRVAFDFVSVKVTVSPLGGAGVMVAVRVTLEPTVTVAFEIARAVVVGVFTELAQAITKLYASTEPRPVT